MLNYEPFDLNKIVGQTSLAIIGLSVLSGISDSIANALTESPEDDLRLSIVSKIWYMTSSISGSFSLILSSLRTD